MDSRSRHESIIANATLMIALKQGDKQTFKRDDGVDVVVIPREKFLDLIAGVGGEEEDYTDG